MGVFFLCPRACVPLPAWQYCRGPYERGGGWHSNLNPSLSIAFHPSRVGAAVLTSLYGDGISAVHPDDFVPFMGTGEANFLGGVAKAKGIADPDVAQLKAAFFDSYISACTAPGAPSIEAPGARALVAACRAAGLKTAVATAADLIKADANLRAAGFAPGVTGRFDPSFDALVTADAFERLKPAPDAFLAAAAAVGVPPSRCCVIEDAPAGIAAARAAGMRVLGITSTLSPAQMEAEQPDGMASSPAEVSVDLLKGLKLREGVVLGMATV